MKKFTLCSVIVLLLLPSVQAIEPATHLNLETVSSIAIQEGGRYKPLQSYAGKVMEMMTGRWSFKGADPVAYMVSMLAFPDEWLNEDIILLEHRPLKESVGLDPLQKHFSYNTLMSNAGLMQIYDRAVQKMRADQDLTLLENKVAEVLHRCDTLRSIISGDALKIVPAANTDDVRLPWLPISGITGYSNETQSKLHDLFTQWIGSVRNSNAASFERLSEELKDTLASLNPAVYPAEYTIEREMQYNEARPFLWSWIIFLLAFFVLLVSFFFDKKPITWSGVGLYVLGYIICTYGLLIRCLIAGRPPVSNMYESVIYVGWGVLTFALIFEALYRQKWFITVASITGFTLIVMADLMPFDSNVEPLVPVLRSSYWLIIHVMTITISYSAFALAMALAHVVLITYMLAKHRVELMKTVANFMYRVIQTGTVLLAAGTILGGVWAADSWGRFWGWDPKETWALISLLGYMAILHARFIGWIRMVGLAIASILGFWLIIMTWYGVNFVLGKGLHSYGFGAGGGWYVASYLSSEILFLAVFAVRYFTTEAPNFVSQSPGELPTETA